MKKFFASLVFVVMLVPCAYAVGIGGFQDINATIITVNNAIKMRDDAYVTMQGNILKRLTKDEYLFADATGNIVVEVDDDKWAGQIVHPDDVLEITGEIDRKYKNIKVEVETLRILQKK